MVLSKRIMVHEATSVVTYVMHENYYDSGKVTYSISKRNHHTNEFIEWVVRSVRRSTADAVWYDTVIDRP